MPNKEWVATVTWTCLTCPGQLSFEDETIGAHMLEVHGMDPKTTKGNRRGLLFMDGQDFFRNVFEYEFQGLKLRRVDYGEKVKVHADQL